MSRTPLDTARASRRLVTLIGVIGIAASCLWAFSPLMDQEDNPAPVRLDAALSGRGPASPPDLPNQTTFPDRAATVTLNDDLFPPAPAPTQEPERPPLGATLIAIVQRDSESVAYLREEYPGITRALRAGERLENGALIESVGPAEVRLTLDGFDYTLELDG